MRRRVVVRKQPRRNKVMGFFKALSPRLIGLEACDTAHYWARELTKLGHAATCSTCELLTKAELRASSGRHGKEKKNREDEQMHDALEHRRAAGS